MARKKEVPQPFFEIRDPFIASMNNFVDKSMLLHQVVKSALDFDCISNKAVADAIRKQLAELDAAMFREGE